MTYSKILSLCAAFGVTTGGLFAITPSAFAKNQPVVVVAPADVPTRRVSYADLNLATMTGEKMLNHRVARAVSWVCNESVGPSTRDFYGETGCRSVAWGGARPQMKLAVQRAHDIAATGSSLIAVQAITIVASR